jgi:sugar/nucleoside kinase (ribokinase family)
MVVDEIIDRKDQVAPRRALGGAPSYSSLALSSLGFRPGIVTHVGNDFPEEYANLVREKTGLDVQKWVDPGYKTTSYRIDRSGTRRRLWLIAKCRNIEFADFPSGSGYNSVVVNPVAGEISLSVLREIVAKYRNVFVDSQGFVRSFDPKTGEVGMKIGMDIASLKGVTVLKADLEELRAWTGEERRELAISLLSKYIEILLVTSGPSAVEVYRAGSFVMKATPFAVEVGDTTGAGDIMLSSFAAKFTDTLDLKDSLAFSLTASTLAIRNYGVEKALLSRDEVETESTRVAISA